MAKTTKAPAKKAASKNASARKAATKKSPTKRPAKKAAAKKGAAKKSAAKKAAPKKVAKRTAAKKSAPKKTAPKKPAVKAPTKAPAKKPAAKKPAAKKPAPKKPAKSPYDKKFLDAQQEALLEERARLTKDVEGLEAEANELAMLREPGDVQFDEESGEGDTLNIERERDLALSASARAAVEEVDRALARMVDSTYGICERCGKRISVARLEALPYAALCIDCKSREERRR